MDLRLDSSGLGCGLVGLRWVTAWKRSGMGKNELALWSWGRMRAGDSVRNLERDWENRVFRWVTFRFCRQLDVCFHGDECELGAIL
jgi:hypothetical protein